MMVSMMRSIVCAELRPAPGGEAVLLLSLDTPLPQAVLDEALDMFPRDQWDVAYGSSGTVGAIADVLAANGRDGDTIARLGADDHGMRSYVMVLLRTGPTPIF